MASISCFRWLLADIINDLELVSAAVTPAAVVKIHHSHMCSYGLFEDNERLYVLVLVTAGNCRVKSILTRTSCRVWTINDSKSQLVSDKYPRVTVTNDIPCSVLLSTTLNQAWTRGPLVQSSVPSSAAFANIKPSSPNHNS